MSSTIPTHLKFKPPNPVCSVFTRPSVYCFRFQGRNPVLFCSRFSVLTRACSDGGKAEIFSPKKVSSASDDETLRNSSSSSSDGYIALFIRMLGLDNDPLDREQAVEALWKYSLGGKQCVDNIMKYPGTVNLVVNLLKSDSDSACESAAGLLRVISSTNLYRDVVAESGAIEEMTVLLTRPSLCSNVKEQTMCTLWNLSVDKEVSARMTSSEILPLLVKYLEDEDVKVKEAACGVLTNLALTQSNHKLLVEAGVIPKLAKLLTADEEESKVVRKVARNALLELVKDEYYKILVMEEGLVPVPLVGAAAYKSFRPALYSWPSLPDGTTIEQGSKSPSRYGASELLLGLSIEEKNSDLEEAKMKAVVGRTQQQFLARIGAIEIEDDGKSDVESSSSHRVTLLPWVDAVARLVLILGLEDESAIAKAAESIADASINEHMRVSFREAGAIKHLVQLINHPCDDVKMAVIRALDRLSISETILNILTRILDPNKELKAKLYEGPVNGLNKGVCSTETPASLNTQDTISAEPIFSTESIGVAELVDSGLLSCLVDILKTPTPDIQRKAASILEFVVVIEEPSAEKLPLSGIVPGLEAVFCQKSLIEDENGREVHILEVEEAGLAVSAASRLLTRLLDYQQFCQSLDSDSFTKLLRSILVSITTLHERIPRLIEEMESSFSPQVQESAVMELNWIISQGTVDSSRAVARSGGIFAVVKLMETGSEEAVEACLAILYNLSMDAENHTAIVAAGAVPVLRRLVLSDRQQWMRALRLLRTLPTSYD
ncbi:hypothetical protein SASPL_149368 [Salvia splendens]|uniref:Vacuolar protein 8 n=1 Tax=Salvia splendens TaxID=180675 RepID=A0A8X8WB04_SALSN|nr:hypothetical protein SASPL_149368 [Salvia splendens]